jgi:hypothetical protein
MQDAPRGTVIRENAVWVLNDRGRFDLVEHWFGFMAADTELLSEQGRVLTYLSHFPGSQSPQAKRVALRELLVCATANVALIDNALALRKERDDPSPHLQAYERARRRAKECTQSLSDNLALVESLMKASARD